LWCPIRFDLSGRCSGRFGCVDDFFGAVVVLCVWCLEQFAGFDAARVSWVQLCVLFLKLQVLIYSIEVGKKKETTCRGSNRVIEFGNKNLTL